MTTFKKPRTKIITLLLVTLAVAAGLIGLFLLNSGNSAARLRPPGEAGYNVWLQTITVERQPSTTSPVQATAPRTPTPSQIEDANDTGQDESGVDWHYIDPDTEKSVKALLGNFSSTAPASQNNLKPLPLPTQYRPGQYNPLGPATISFEAFQFFLRQSNSPALPEANTLYIACLRLYCDPAVALAFFEHESSMGRAGVAAENKSWGNIRCTPGASCRTTSNNGSFKSYATWTDGIIDWVILLRETYATRWKLYSLEQIIPRYAPSADNNNPNGYINTVKNLVNKYRSFTPPVTRK